jgi:hypothetical protein
MKRLIMLALLLAASLMSCSRDVYCQGLTSIEILSGTAYNFQTPLVISQEGQPDIDLHARYDTKPLKMPFYYCIRAGLKWGSAPWEVQFIHHKLYLHNKPDYVQKFEITHGFNILTLNRVFETGVADLRIGAGLVAAHAESRVRNLSYSGEGGPFYTGYRVTGPAFISGVGKHIPLSSRFFISTEVQLTAAWARVPVAQGNAAAPNVALHGLVGTGYRF